MAFDELILKDSTSQMIEVYLRDSTTGMGKTGLANTDVTCYYRRQGAAAGVEVSLADATLGVWETGGFKECSATNEPGLYQFGMPDAALATGANGATFIFEASGVIDARIKVLLLDCNLRDAARLGLTSLPNANPAANGGLPTVNASNQIAGLVAGSIVAATFATDSIAAGAVKADAVTKIQDGLATSANQATIAGYLTNATYGLSAIRTQGDAAWITATSVTVSDKTGFALAADGLDTVSAVLPSGEPANFREMVLTPYVMWAHKSVMTTDTWTVYAADGETELWTYGLSEVDGVQTKGALTAA